MKNFLNKVHDLSKKAAEIKQAVQSAPAKAAELRQAVTMTAGELQQLRTDVQANLNGLRAHNEERLLHAMREVNDASLVFEEAGYELTGMDLDLSLNQRLAVSLTKFKDEPHAALRVLVAKESREIIKAILAGILKAEETAANVELSYLHLDGVIIHVGAIPLVRMCWRSDRAVDVQQSSPTVATSVPTTPTPPIGASSIGSLFEHRSIPASKVTSPSPSTTIPTPVVEATKVSESVPSLSSSRKQDDPSTASPWSRDALDRFKKMPNLSKHRH